MKRNQTMNDDPPLPLTADFPFDYAKLLRDTHSGIGMAPHKDVKVAIVGAGIAGLTVGCELLRAGYKNIQIFEASDRIGGRMWSVMPEVGGATPYDTGAMRFPLFVPEGQPARSLVQHYVEKFDLKTKVFDNPGDVHTGVILGEQAFVNSNSTIKAVTGETPGIFKVIEEAWSTFSDSYKMAAKQAIRNEKWDDFWKEIVQHYWTWDFRELANASRKGDSSSTWNFGGIGLTKEQSKILETIGIGDGGWGAFYDITSLYIFRTILSGFVSPYHMIVGRKPTTPMSIRSNGQVHNFLGFGAQSLPEYMFFGQESDGRSLFNSAKVKLHLYKRVESLTRKQIDGTTKIVVTTQRDNIEGEFDVVVITAPTRAFSHSVTLNGFNQVHLLNGQLMKSIADSHWISGCKVFFPLKKRFWEVSDIPKVMVTDTWLGDVYGYAVDGDPGVLLASYTWEEKVEGFAADIIRDERQLADKVLNKLDLITKKFFNESIKEYVHGESPYVHYWSALPTYRGCSKLTRARSWADDRALSTYNQSMSDDSHLYFAGEGYSVEGGWVEPALRQAIDAVIYIIRNTGGSFTKPFEFGKYPQYDLSWFPTSSK